MKIEYSALVVALLVAVFGLTANGEPNKVAAQPSRSAASAQAVEGEADVAVTVNGVNITEGQIETQMKPSLAQVSAQLPPTFVEQYKKQLRAQFLDKMIIEQLLDEQVKSHNIVITDEQVTSEIEKMTAQQGMTVDDLKSLLASQGRSFDDIKQRIHRGLGYQKFLESQWAGKIDVNDKEVRDYYSANPASFEIPEQIRASHILIRPAPADANTDPNQAKAAAKTKANDLLRQIKGGSDFAKLAQNNSADGSAAAGGDLGFFARGQMVPAFEQAAFALKVGQVSDVVETQFGYHIIKVTGHKDPNNLSFEQARDDIKKALTRQKQAESTMKYLEQLKAGAKIVYPPGKEPVQEGDNKVEQLSAPSASSDANTAKPAPPAGEKAKK